jgi:NADPH:quinone reductase-like Zn-dependent oxidoreductase
MLAGLPRMARAALMRFGSTKIRFVNCVVDRDNLQALATLLQSGGVRAVIDKVYPLAEAGQAVAHMYGHHARGKIAVRI